MHHCSTMSFCPTTPLVRVHLLPWYLLRGGEYATGTCSLADPSATAPRPPIRMARHPPILVGCPAGGMRRMACGGAVARPTPAVGIGRGWIPLCYVSSGPAADRGGAGRLTPRATRQRNPFHGSEHS